MWKALAALSMGLGTLLPHGAGAQQATPEVGVRSDPAVTTSACNQEIPPPSCIVGVPKKPGRPGGIINNVPQTSIAEREFMLEKLQGSIIDRQQ